VLDLDFNVAEMSIEEIQTKLREITEAKHKIDLEETPEAKQASKELSNLHDKLQEKYTIRVDSEGMKDANGNQIYDQSGQVVSQSRFLSMDQEQQKQIMTQVGVSVDDASYEAFVSQVEDNVLTQKIQTAVQSGDVDATKSEQEVKE